MAKGITAPRITIGLDVSDRFTEAVAVARKLAVLLHRLWITGEVYQAIGYGRTEDEQAEPPGGQKEGDEHWSPSGRFRGSRRR